MEQENNASNEAPEVNAAPQIPVGLMNLSASLEGLTGAAEILTEVGTDAVKAGIIKVSGEPAAADNKPADNKPAPVADTAKPADITKPADTVKPEDKKDEGAPEVEEDEDEESDDDKKNILLQSVKPKGPVKKEFQFENIDQVKDASKKTLGIEIKSEKDFGKVFTSALKWREDAQKLPDLEEKVQQLEGIFNNMPAPLLNATKAYFEGRKDWDKEITSRPSFDFSKPAEKQDIKVLTAHYFPGEFTEEDYTAETKPKALQIAEKASIEKFNADKHGLEVQSATQQRDAKARQDARALSVTSSLEHLKQSLPNLDTKDVKVVAKVLESGDINSLFFNKDGSYKSDAAEKIIMALYGKGTINSLMKISAKRAESKTNEDILTRAADKPKPQKGGNSPAEVVDAKTQKAIDALVGGLNKTKTYS